MPRVVSTSPERGAYGASDISMKRKAAQSNSRSSHGRSRQDRDDRRISRMEESEGIPMNTTENRQRQPQPEPPPLEPSDFDIDF